MKAAAPWYTIVIPTRDSAAWIGPLLEHYRAHGVVPTLLLDSRTRDDTETIARRAGVPIIGLAPFKFTEAIVAVTREAVQTPWAFLVNDDEIPSDRLFQRLAGPEPPMSVQSVAISRRWAWHEPGMPLRWGCNTIWRDRAGRDGADHHWRLFRPTEVTFVAAMHSDGFLIDRWSRLPPDAYLVHFEWVLRCRSQRQAKLRRYDRHRYGYGAFFANMYLPEDQPTGFFDYIPFETDAYDRLAQIYYAARGPDVPLGRRSLAEHYARLRQALAQRLHLSSFDREPKDRVGLTPRLDREVPDPYGG
jgi:hypothetical protein